MTGAMPTESTDRNLRVSGDAPPRKPSVNQSATAGRASRVCWDVEPGLAVLLLALAGIVILALLYWALLLRHKLRVAQAGNDLEYFGFYRMAQYDLKQPETSIVTPPPLPPPPPVLHVSPPLPVFHITPPPPVFHITPPPPVLHIPPPPPKLLCVPPSIIQAPPPSPHPSVGAGSDVEVYSRIGLLRPSRASSASQTQVVLFEHSAL